MKRSAFFVVNPKSGKGNYQKVAAYIERYGKHYGLEFRVRIWERKEQLGELMAEAMNGAYDVIYAVGGDGTVHEVGKYLIGTPFTLGILPNGSGDGIARHCSIPKKISENLSLITKGQVIAMDTGLMNDKPFIGFMGLGLDARVAHGFEGLTKRGFVPYVKLALSEYFKKRTEEFEVSLDGGESFCIKPQVLAIANTSQFGNGAHFSPGSSATDGILELCKLDPINNAQLPMTIIRIFNATCTQIKGYGRWSFQEALIHRTSDEDFGQLDGEAIRTGKKIFIKVQKKSLYLLVPKLGIQF